jgi:phosphoribosylamine--glycine ligase
MAKTPFFFVSDDASALPLALRLQRDGHPVQMFVKDKEAKHVGEGIIHRVNAPAPPKGAVVIFADVGKGALGRSLRAKGHATIGGNDFEDTLEHDRPAGAKLMKDAGIRTPETVPFQDIPAALKFLENTKGQWFVKVCGADAAGGAETFDAPDSESMMRYLRWKQTQGKIKPFELQRRVPGVEISTNGFFDGKKFVLPYDFTLEEKRLFPGELGPRTGCESCLVWHAPNEILAKRGLAKIADVLARHKYVGPLDLNAMVQADGTPLGLEWTARLGYDWLQAWMRLFDSTLGEQLEAFARGELSAWEPVDPDLLAATLRISIPPYPTWKPELVAKVQGLPLDERILTDFYIDPVDVMVSQAKRSPLGVHGVEGVCAAGSSGIICTVAAVGESIQGLRDDMLDLAGSLNIPQKQYRNDPLARVDHAIATLGPKLVGDIGDDTTDPEPETESAA